MTDHGTEAPVRQCRSDEVAEDAIGACEQHTEDNHDRHCDRGGAQPGACPAEMKPRGCSGDGDKNECRRPESGHAEHHGFSEVREQRRAKVTACVWDRSDRKKAERDDHVEADQNRICAERGKYGEPHGGAHEAGVFPRPYDIGPEQTGCYQEEDRRRQAGHLAVRSDVECDAGDGDLAESGGRCGYRPRRRQGVELVRHLPDPAFDQGSLTMYLRAVWARAPTFRARAAGRARSQQRLHPQG